MTIKKTNKLKILNDPIYGFILIPNELIFDLIEHPYFQRLRRISQMGLSHLVYPGAHHTRFHHAIGSMHLMQKAVRVLRFKGVEISDDEANAVYIAILLHDIGHGPFSHALEHSIVTGVHHEQISLKFMEAMNEDFDGKLTLAIEIFKGNYHRNFLYQLISSQLDMDRLDYLKRDSFYTGVAEGNVNSERLITMLNVIDDELVVEEKGIYSVEKFINARRLMYWQVYLHKTGVVAEKLLEKVLERAYELSKGGMQLPASKAFSYFLKNDVNEKDFNRETLETFARLDDYDVLLAIKEWIAIDDKVLSRLSESLINRRLPRVELRKEEISDEEYEKVKNNIRDRIGLTENEVNYFVYRGNVMNHAYNMEKDTIKIIYKSGEVVDIVSASDHLNVGALSRPVYKYYICYPKK